jgi:hypothetical protein
MEKIFVRDAVRRAVLSILLIIGVALTLNSAFAAQSVTLEWNPSTDPSVTGYNIYYGAASRTYTNKIDVGNSTNVTVNGLVEGVTYYFAATAYNILGAESDYSAEVSYTIPVPAGNQPPTLTAIPNLTINEDAAQQTVNMTGITAGPSESQPITITASSGNTALIPNPTVNYTSPSSTGSLNFTPVPNANGSAVITVTVNDNQGSNNLFMRTFTVTVNPVNDPPTIDPINSVTINEDGGLQTVNLSGITSGTNESQTLTVTASSSNTGLIPNPTVSYSSPNATGSLSFTSVTNASGTATITVTVNDGQAANNLATRQFTVTVAAVNDPPTFSAISDLSINESASAQTVSVTGINAGPGESQTLTLTATSGNTALIPNPTVTYTSPSANGSLSFTPVAGANGSAVITVTVNDNAGSNNLFSRTFTVNVNPVNDPPTINTINNLTINEDSGLQTVSLSGITAGTNESQALTVTASSSNTGLIPTPTVSYTSPNTTGSLSFSPATNASGTSVITVTVNDGQSANNITTRQFTVTVAPVNDPPTLNSISDITVNQGQASQAVNLSGISAGPGESQTLTVTATSSNPGLVPNPTVTYTSPNAIGTLTASPSTNNSGSAVITVTVNDNQGSNNIVTRTFNFIVNARPMITPISNQTISTNSNTGPLGFVIGDRETPAANLIMFAASSVPSLIPTNNVVFGGSDSNRTVTVTPLLTQSGTANITLTVSDGSAVSNITFQVTVLGPPVAPTGLQIIGGGSLTGGVGPNSILNVGQTYTLTAVPDVGEVFAGWSGSYTSSSPKLTFTYQTNMSIQAHFVHSPYIPIAGRYNGLFYEDAQINLPTSGFFSINVTPAGTYSGSLTIGVKKYPFTGKLPLNNLGTNRLVLAGIPVIMDFEPQGDTITGHITSGSWVSTMRGDPCKFNSSNNPAPYFGKYTMVIPGTPGDELLPAGHGVGTPSVNGSGMVAFGGTLADGTKFTSSAYLSPNGEWPLYIPLYKGKGSVLSWMTFANRANDDINGALSWIKQPNASPKIYRGGFLYECEAIGSLFTAPAVGSNILPMTSGQMTFDGGNLGAGFVNSIGFGTNSHLINYSSNSLTATFSTAKGTILGKVKAPNSSAKAKPTTFNGVVLQKANAAYGFLLGTNQCSEVVLTP